MDQADIITRIIRAVAAADGVAMDDVDRLYEYIDPDVLLKLDEQNRGEWSLTFQFGDHLITIDHDSRLLVDGVAYTTETSVN